MEYFDKKKIIHMLFNKLPGCRNTQYHKIGVRKKQKILSDALMMMMIIMISTIHVPVLSTELEPGGD